MITLQSLIYPGAWPLSLLVSENVQGWGTRAPATLFPMPHHDLQREGHTGVTTPGSGLFNNAHQAFTKFLRVKVIGKL